MPPLRSTTTAAYEQERELTPIFPFDAAPEATAALWERIDDVVMGGVSSSKIVTSDDAGAEWRGIVRTDGGGFCGARTAALEAPLDLSKADGIYVDAILTSDADISRRAWKLTLRTGASRSEIVYSAEWAPRGPDGIGGPTFVPFSDFKLVRGPRIVEGAPPLNASQCASVYGFGLTLSRFGAASVNMTEVENFRDGPFSVKLNAVGVYGSEQVAVPTLAKSVADASKPNSPGSPMKSNGLVLGLALTVLRPIASLVFSEKGRRRRQARRTLVKRGKVKSDWAARFYGQRVVKRMRGLKATGARIEGLREFTRDAAAYALALPLRLAFRSIFGTARLIRRLRGKKALPPL
jgi:hypothetical protein